MLYYTYNGRLVKMYNGRYKMNQIVSVTSEIII